MPDRPVPPPTWRERLRRALRHVWQDERDAERLLPPDVQQRLAEHVQACESRHGGEIRLCVEAGLPLLDAWRGVHARQRAIQAFTQLRVWDTEHNNGVLVYLLLADHAIEIVADRGLQRFVAPHQWREILDLLSQSFQAGHHEEGLHQAIDAVSALLFEHFPLGGGARRANELPDQPVLR